MSERKTGIQCPGWVNSACICKGRLDLEASRATEPPVIHDPGSPITGTQKCDVYAIATKKGLPEPEHFSGWTKGEASAWIDQNGWVIR